MKRLILHIGPHKTGSTYLQRELLRNRELLLQEGVLYPDTMLEQYGHTKLANCLKDDSVIQLKECLSSINSYPGDVIISSENLFNMTEKQIKKLSTLFDYSSVVIVAFFRQPTSRFLSLWHEYVKSGMVVDYFEFSNSHIIRPFRSLELNISNRLKIFEEHFKNSSVKIIDYEKSVEKKSTLTDFFSAIDQYKPFEEKWDSVNASFDFRDVEVLRILNYISSSSKGGMTGHALRMSFVKGRAGVKAILENDIFPVMGQYMREINIGGTALDVMLKNDINSTYGNPILSLFDQNVDGIQLPSSLWTLNPTVNKALHKVHSLVAFDDHSE